MKKPTLLILLGLVMACGVIASPLRDSLAMFESGATSPKPSAADHVLGASGEVSRFQIMPEVWREYSASTAYSDPEVSWRVAQRILEDRIAGFQRVTRREATPLEIYLLWNKPGHFANAGYHVENVRPLYRERAQRFENLFLSLKSAPSIVAVPSQPK